MSASTYHMASNLRSSLGDAFSFVHLVARASTRRDRLYWGSALLLTMLLAASTYAIPLVQKASLESVLQGKLSATAVGGLISVGLVVIVATIVRSLMLAQTNLSIQRSLQLQMIENGILRPEAEKGGRGAGGYISHVFGDAEQVGMLLGSAPFEGAAVQLVLFAAIVATGGAWSWIFPACVLPAVALSAVGWSVAAALGNRHYVTFREELTETNPLVLEMLESRFTVLGYYGVRSAMSTIESRFRRRDAQHQRVLGWEAFGSAITGVVSLAAQVAFFVLALGELQAGRLSIPELVALLAFLSAALAPLPAFKQALDGFFRLLVLKSRTDEALSSPEGSALPVSPAVRLDECRIPFLSRHGDVPLSLDITEPLFLLGGSGAGKTSLIQVVLGNRDPLGGRCLWGDAPAAAVPAELRFRSARYLSQVIEVLNGSARFNVCFDRQAMSTNERDALRERVSHRLAHAGERGSLTPEDVDLLRQVGIGGPTEQRHAVDVLASSPAAADYLAALYVDATTFDQTRFDDLSTALGLDSFGDRPLGVSGRYVSGGERQRIGLARFLLPTSSHFFVLDEPFTNLDAVTKERCVKTLQRFLPSSPGLIITHDVALVRRLGLRVVFVTADGNLDVGTFDEVCSRSHELADIVAAWDAAGD